MTSLRDVMSTTVTSVAATTTISEAAELMVRGRFGSVVVMRGDMVEGIFTERDVLRAVGNSVDVQVETVAKWMTEDPITSDPDTDTEEAVGAMISGGFRHLPVVDANRLVGIVSLRDLLSARIGRD